LATEEDVPLIYRWRQDEEVAYWSSGGHGYSAVTYSQLLERIRSQRSDSRSLMLMVEIREDEGWKPIGACRHFRDFDAISRSVIIGFSIGEKSYWGKGYGTRALRVFVGMLFQRYNLHRIQLDTFDENQRAMRSVATKNADLSGKAFCGKLFGPSMVTGTRS
jgi:RimJ/RimL family protein N-acetyltransferase